MFGKLNRVLFASLIWSVQAIAQVYPIGFSQSVVTGNLLSPTSMAFSSDGRIFIGQQGGKVRVLKNNVLLPIPLVKLTVDSLGERGLVGLELHPQFPSQPYIYIYYTVPPGTFGPKSHNRISRFNVDGDLVIPGSEFVLLDLANLGDSKNHNGGSLKFGVDGNLYVAVGDAGLDINAQNLDRFFGKILRLRPDGSAPSDNPFASSPLIRKYFWAYGLRNPFTVSIQKTSGRIFINDVGLKDFEEIDEASVGGKNFGWPVEEGFGTNPSFENPLYAYAHGIADGIGCAITGGTFFNPAVTNFPSDYYGKYFFMDFCGKWINYIDYTTTPAVRYSFAKNIAGSGIGLMTGPDGNLYYISRTTNSLYRITYNQTTIPYFTNQPAGVSVLESKPATIKAHAVGSSVLSYQWQKNGVDMPGETRDSLLFTETLPGDSAKYRLVVTNAAGSVTSSEVLLSVTTVYTPPSVKILDPINGTKYAAGMSLPFSGSATDRQEGTLALSTYDWKIYYHTPASRELMVSQPGANAGSYDIPKLINVSPLGWYQLVLSATDSTFLTSSDSVNVFPQLTDIQVATQPSGLYVIFDGIEMTDSLFNSVVGSQHQLEVNTHQSLNGTAYEFMNWEPSVENNQFETPENPVAYAGIFTPILGANNDAPANTKTYPNPAKQVAYLSVHAIESAMATMTITNVHGQTLHNENVALSKGKNEIRISTEQFPAGLYFININPTGSKRIVEKLMVVK